ncbi:MULTISPECIES: thiamine pyrophosphate-dependent enzyme [Natrinema]|uniref:2-ketoglutarate ferredoxin oxidoreductase subunit beta n=2 Tax=Natrinema TaxID=88723 RepID=A0A2A5QVT2_9EURY|nr:MULTISPECIES: thiamine pyrophosphate-dependent enzyme [Natrinema]MBZ6493836.1 2-ketoglutarate ferredoxin oxidoreductase subunit beta [Natrinema longum]PCR90859.1 2-ketoglutarate ferredoxin oxidoreductase subunit beta [Natrinema ejinorense]QSW84827.1 2-ketoglutarate ferredoxin oxidoreductase subunit beta [Natrinema longum]
MSAFNAIGEEREIDRDEFTPGVEPQPTWCPGCGDFGVLKSLKQALPEVGKTPEEVLTVTGIGCSGKLNSYLDTYGFHTIHGRSLPVARAAKLANTDLEVIAAGGDGDGYGIGGNHFIHTARENHDMTYIVFNNEIFGLTKGQTSPTSPKGHKSKTQPSGSAKTPLRPLSLSLTAGASYVARTAAVNPNQAKEIIAEAIEHDGFAHVDFLTQCPTWNKDARQYVPYIDIQESDDYDHDVTDRREAAEMMHETEDVLNEGTVLTGRYYVDEDRPSYQAEKSAVGELPDQPLAERYFDDDAEWERSYDLLERHT